MPTIMWSSGDVASAATWDELEEEVRSLQYRAYRPETFRDVLAKRALLWTNTEVDVTGTSEQLFRALEAAKLITVLDEREKGDED